MLKDESSNVAELVGVVSPTPAFQQRQHGEGYTAKVGDGNQAAG